MTAYIGTKNYIRDPGVVINVSSEILGNERELAVDWNTFTSWKANTSGLVYYTIDFGVDVTFDSWGMGLTNLSDNNGWIIPQFSTDNFTADIRDFDFSHTPVNNDIATKLVEIVITARYWRFKINSNGQPSYFGHLWFGNLIPLPNKMKSGFIQPKHGRVTKVMNNKSETGAPLGTSILSKGVEFKIKQDLLSPAWIDTNWEGIIDHLESPNRLLFVWDQENRPDESVLAWTDGKISNPKFKNRLYMGFSISCVGYVR